MANYPSEQSVSDSWGTQGMGTVRVTRLTAVAWLHISFPLCYGDLKATLCSHEKFELSVEITTQCVPHTKIQFLP